MARNLEASGVEALPTSSALHHVLTNVLSAHHPLVRVETHSRHLDPDDALVFCSDGLNALSSDVILATLAAAPSAAVACRDLVRRALDADGSDNVTVIVGRLRSGGPERGSRT